jgi:hypothetical protein
MTLAHGPVSVKVAPGGGAATRVSQSEPSGCGELHDGGAARGLR